MRFTLPTLAAVLALSATAAIAQPAGYTGPSNVPQATNATGPYSGPSNVPLMTVKQLLETGRDDQIARLQGRLVSFEGDERYTFEDATGRITVEIDNEDFPAGQSISAEQKVELTGEFDKGLRKTEFEVDRLTLVP
ncbi:NirD/YgiW/YdeI family stress tolerance protein [Alcaligenes sp. AB3]|uniref:YgiW/YdeI family stress tolerance OB fold protein n=1 Tax=Alcaligenes sp. AB3 TaxID=2962569 RepID=UPI00288139BD|nr:MULTISPECIES: NirD/YgiW/YdeI family stress tolerance protein [Alcaligenes]MDT0218662.1 NirD/YgiW/YdeI family stress tolerance protein [Alcaligenes sp. AB3]